MIDRHSSMVSALSTETDTEKVVWVGPRRPPSSAGYRTPRERVKRLLSIFIKALIKSQLISIGF